MEKCKHCGAERTRIGVMYPARPLCPCEKGICSTCNKPATLVEFQSPVRDAKEPSLQGPQALLLCDSHAPAGFPVNPGKVKKGKGLPQIDPAWTACTAALPKGITSKQHVKCIRCQHAHELRQRVMFNGTYSYCPKPSCGEDMYVPLWDEDDVNEKGEESIHA